MQLKKVTAKQLQDIENIAKILQYIEETHPTKQQLQQKFVKPNNPEQNQAPTLHLETSVNFPTTPNLPKPLSNK